MAAFTHLYTTPGTRITAGTWNDPTPKLAIHPATDHGVSINLPTRPDDAAALLNNLIDAADAILATIPGHRPRTTTTINGQ